MEAFNGVIINKVNGGLVRESDTGDRVLLLICGATATDKVPNYKPVKLNSIEALEQLDVSAETDKTNKELLYYHCSETFRLSPERELWLMTVPKAIKATELTVAADFLSAIRAVGGVNTIGIAGIAADSTIQDAANALQLMVETLREDHL